MGKLFKILVASVGSGMAIGFGVRSLAESSQRRRLSIYPDRISALELRLESLESAGEPRVAESVAGLINQRIEHLEAAVASQASAMQELRDCTLHTERNLQKLLAGIDRLVASQERTVTTGPEIDGSESILHPVRRTGA